jgi:hypothetical protein
VRDRKFPARPFFVFAHLVFLMADLSEDIETAATGPRIVKADGVEVTAHDLESLIEADKYLKSNDAASKPHRGLRFTKLIPGGTNG